MTVTVTGWGEVGGWGVRKSETVADVIQVWPLISLSKPRTRRLAPPRPN